MPWLEKGGEGKGPHGVLYWRMTPQWAVRDGRYKLVHTAGGTELFDLAKDPGERTDLTKSQGDVAKKMQGEFDGWNSELMAPRWPGKQEGDNQGPGAVGRRVNPNGPGEGDD